MSFRDIYLLYACIRTLPSPVTVNTSLKRTFLVHPQQLHNIQSDMGAFHLHFYCEAQGVTMELCVHRMLYCSMYNLSVDEFRCQDFVPKDWVALRIPDLVSMLSQRWNADRPASRFVIGLQSRLFKIGLGCAGRSLWRRQDLWREAGSGHEDSSHNILTSDALQVCLVPGNPWSCQCPCG
jgi:hypothetical protein